MVDPGERGRYLANSLWHEHRQWFSERHDSHSRRRRRHAAVPSAAPLPFRPPARLSLTLAETFSSVPN
jgi:hypothetical protein